MTSETWILAGTYSSGPLKGQPQYHRADTAIGPASTPDLELAMRFASREAACSSEGFLHWSSFLEPTLLSVAARSSRHQRTAPRPILTTSIHPQADRMSNLATLARLRPEEPTLASPTLAKAREFIASAGAKQIEAFEGAMIAAKLAAAEVGGADDLHAPRMLQLAHQAEAVIRSMVLELDLIRNGKQ